MQTNCGINVVSEWQNGLHSGTLTGWDPKPTGFPQRRHWDPNRTSAGL